MEPTALATLALASAPATAQIGSRLEEGARYLVDRRCHTGGWNVGNPIMFSQTLPPRAHPTALALLALKRVAAAEIRPGDLAALRAAMQADAGTPALALGALALRACSADAWEALAQLQRSQQPDGGWDGSPFHTALALFALEEGAGL